MRAHRYHEFENGKEDHNVLARLHGEEVIIDDKVINELTEFVSHVFDHRVGKIVKVGRFLGKEEADEYIKQCLD